MVSDSGYTQGPIRRDIVGEHGLYRFLAPHLHPQSVFGDDWFAVKAEAFARLSASIHPIGKVLSAFNSNSQHCFYFPSIYRG